jgi:copper oxidase (laccase) domain-containing protein
MVADCVPIVLVDPTAEVLGVVHAGWRGTVAGVVRATVAAMVGEGAAPERLVAGIGPSVRAEEYQVGSDVADGIVALLGDDPRSPSGTPVLRPDPPDPGGTPRWRCDLAGANAAALVACGVHPDNIHDTGHHSGDGAFFSDRVARPCGRFAVVARLRHHSGTVQ